MGRKERRNISIDADVNEAIENGTDNFSEEVNRWARLRYVEGKQDVVDRVMVEQLRTEINERFEALLEHVDEQYVETEERLRQIEQDREEFERRVEGERAEVTEKLDSILEQLDGIEQDGEELNGKIEDAADTLGVGDYRTVEDLDPDNSAVKKQANNVRVTPETLIEEIENRCEKGVL